MMLKTVFLILAIIVLTSSSYSQKPNDKPIIIEKGGGSCEENSALVDGISNDVKENKERIFVIFRAGKGETETVNAKRLTHVKWFLENRKGWKVFDVIYARGEKSDGEGKIEFYIGGKLFLIMMSAKNYTPCLDCCEGGLENPQNLVKKKRIAKRKS
ncbi:MAG: hypothetical protein M3033_05975 [Acidobacteriota bacterium]|nr:hypothetical protein [Acidobacteriota bacterium]